MMILIADSGSSKTDWAVTGDEGKVLRTQGLNPIHMNERQMSQILRAELLPQLGERVSSIDAVFFYGAGVRADMEEKMERVYKTMRNAGVTNIVVGSLIIAVSVTAGVLAIINGALLLKDKKGITF